jgi:hypothetical protein
MMLYSCPTRRFITIEGVTNSKLMDARIWVLVRTRNFSLNWLQVIEHHAFKFLKYNGQ